MKKIISILISVSMLLCLFMINAAADPDDTEEVNDILLPGDVNEDGEIDSLDATYVLKYDSGTVELIGDHLFAADYSEDGEVDSLDATLILKYDSGVVG